MRKLWKLVALSIVAYGCAAPPIPSSSSETTDKKYDAVTLFRAVYFRDGPAKNVVESWKTPRKELPRAKEKAAKPEVVAASVRDVAKNARSLGLRFTAGALERLAVDVEANKISVGNATTAQKVARQKLVVAAIKKQDPKFFRRFARRLTSGKQTYVMKALVEGQARLASAAINIANPRKTHVIDGDTGEGESAGSDDFSSMQEESPSEPTDESRFSNDDSSAFEDSGSENSGSSESASNEGSESNSGNDGFEGSSGSEGNSGSEDNSGSASNEGSESNSGSDSNSGSEGNSGSASNEDTGTKGGEDRGVGDQAGLVWHSYVAVVDTGVVHDKVAVTLAGAFWSKNDDPGGTQLASFVDHLSTGFGGGK